MKRIFCAGAALIFFLSTGAWAGPEESLFATARIIHQSAENQSPELQRESYKSVRSILDKIVADYPASDIAVRIILQDTIEGLDIQALDSALSAPVAPGLVEEPSAQSKTEEAVVAARPEAAPMASGDESEDVIQLELTPLPSQPQEPSNAPVVSFAVSDEASEEALGLNRNGVRDLQARLLVSGHDPNGVDGALGRGTRAAIRAWQTSVGATATGYMSGDLLAALKEQSQPALEEWLKDDANARRYEPPPPIALGPGNMSGNWRYTSNCGSNSKLGRMKITGNMSMRHAGGSNYTGTLTNSQGLRARLNATLRGRTVSGVANFGFLLGRVRTEARVDDQALILRGRDSNGCSFYARKS